MKDLLKKIVDHPWLNLFVGLFLCYAGLSEAWDSIWQDIITLNFGGHHGVIVLGLVNTFKSLADILKGLE